MRFNTGIANSKNILIYALIAFQLLVLIGIATILITAVSKLSLMTTVSTTVMFLVGLPVLIILYSSSTDKASRMIFLGFLANIAFLSASGIIWYLLSDMLGFAWLVQVAKVLMVMGYVPLMYALFMVYYEEHQKLNLSVKAFIGFINVTCAIAIVFFALTHLMTGNAFDILIYMLSSLGDIVIMALAVSLVIIRHRTALSYIFPIIFFLTLLSLGGDGLNFIDALNVEAYGLAKYSQYFYNLMLLFTAVALLIYSFYREVCSATVDEVNRKLDDSRHTMEDLIVQMPDVACFCDARGTAILVNDPFLRVFGIDRESTVGRFNIFKHGESLKCELSQKLPLLKNGETVFLDRVNLTFPGNRQVYLSMKLFPTFCRDGTISGYMAIMEDITARVWADEELKQAKALAELYIDLMSHDINNMNQVGMGFLEIALDTFDVGDDKKKLLLKPLEAMKNSSRLIDNVKKLRRANEGDVYLRPIDLSKLLKDVIAEHGQAPGREVSMQYDAADNAMVRANELLKDVFVNLVSNAIKHSSGAIHINIHQEAVETDGKKFYRVIVEDDGPGIPEELKPVIFDRILRGRAKVGGNGIGLHLVKTLVDNYGGSITVEDRMPGELKKGTRFIVTLPAA